MQKISIFLILVAVITFSVFAQSSATDPLPSWNNGPAKKAILHFVQTTVDPTSSNYVSPENRIATFDQDGTLWVEQPVYTQVIFALEQIEILAPQHPEWTNEEPFKTVLSKNKEAIAKLTNEDLLKIMMMTHTNISVEAFQQAVQAWIEKAHDPRWHHPYTDLVYQPMLEVMKLLRTNGYKIYIVTGSGQDFVRAYANKVYGIPANQIIGSALKTQYQYDKQNQPVLIQTRTLLLNDNYGGKPENIFLFLGQKPQAAFGNSTGDQQMLEYTESNKGAHLLMLVHHDDAKREYAYGANSKIGTFSDALMNEAKQRGWTVISMKKDWKRIFPFDK